MAPFATLSLSLYPLTPYSVSSTEKKRGKMKSKEKTTTSRDDARISSMAHRTNPLITFFFPGMFWWTDLHKDLAKYNYL